MKIATYNARNLYDAGTKISETAENVVSEEEFRTRTDFLYSLLKEKDLDAVFFQEIGGEKALREIAEKLSYEVFFAQPNSRGIRLALLYRKHAFEDAHIESLSIGELRVPNLISPGDANIFPPIPQRRDVLVMKTKWQEKPLTVITFHLKSLWPVYFGEWKESPSYDEVTEGRFRAILYKMLEMRAIRTLVNQKLESGSEVILLGDYNDDRRSSPVTILKAGSTEETSLVDVLSMYKGDDTTHIHWGAKFSFDTILVSQGLLSHIGDIKVYNDEIKDCSRIPPDEQVIGSDHAMVSVELRS